MTSFAVAVDPSASPRLACLALGVHLAAAAGPWLARVPVPLALPLTAAALASLGSSIAALPGLHHRVAALRIDRGSCRVRMRATGAWLEATVGPASIAFADLVCLDIRADGRRIRWLLPRGAVPGADFRRLKARVRMLIESGGRITKRRGFRPPNHHLAN